MGKTRKHGKKKSSSKHIRSSSNDSANRIPSTFHNVQDSGSVYTDIISLDDNKRLKACRILSNLLLSDNIDTINKIVNHDILSRLAMRLVDKNLDIKYEALGAIRNLASYESEMVSSRLLECGVLEACLTLTHDIQPSSLPITSTQLSSVMITQKHIGLTIQLMSCLGNMVSNHREIALKFDHIGLSFMTFLISSMQVCNISDFNNITSNADSRVKEIFEAKLAIADFLLIATDNLPRINQHLITVSENGLSTLLLNHLHPLTTFIITTIPSKQSSNQQQNESSYRWLTLCLKYIDVVFNITQSLSADKISELMFFDGQSSPITQMIYYVMNILTTTNSFLYTELNAYMLTSMSDVHKSDLMVTTDHDNSQITSNKSNQTDPSIKTIPLVITFILTFAETLSNITYTFNEWLEQKKQTSSQSTNLNSNITTIDSTWLKISPLINSLGTENHFYGFLSFLSYLRAIISNQSKWRSEHNIFMEINILQCLDRVCVCFNNYFLMVQSMNTAVRCLGNDVATLSQLNRIDVYKTNVYNSNPQSVPPLSSVVVPPLPVAAAPATAPATEEDNCSINHLSIFVQIIDMQLLLLESPTQLVGLQCGSASQQQSADQAGGSTRTAVEAHIECNDIMSLSNTNDNAHVNKNDTNTNDNNNDNDNNTVKKEEEEEKETVVDIKSLLAISMKVSISAFECLIAFCSDDASTPFWSNLAMHQPALLQSFTLLLCKCVTFNSQWSSGGSGSGSGGQSDTLALTQCHSHQSVESVESLETVCALSRAALDCASSLACKDNLFYESHPPTGATSNSNSNSHCKSNSTEGNILSIKLNALLTNAILRKLDMLNNMYVQSVSAVQAPVSVIAVILPLFSACQSCLIDLHSSDHVGILNNYIKLKVSEKMKLYLKSTKSLYSYFRQHHVSGSGSGSGSDIDESDIDLIQETMDNAKSFITYKQDAIQEYQHTR